MASKAHPWANLEPAERVARGKGARKDASRSSHGAWEAATDRPDPIALLEEQAETRVPELVPIRYGRMLESPFAFFRGGALIMASDLAATPRTGFTVQLCGDAHLSNFGMFASPERHLLFDINDFDETLPGPWEWDVKRLAASLEICGRDLGFAPADRRDVVVAGVQGYRETMLGAARMGALEAWYEHIRVADVMAGCDAGRRRAGGPEGGRADGAGGRQGSNPRQRAGAHQAWRWSAAGCASSPTPH